ncbi:hypothetical protein N9L76_02325 [bacterium]|nr:hypothetical protein [bacterium]
MANAKPTATVVRATPPAVEAAEAGEDDVDVGDGDGAAVAKPRGHAACRTACRASRPSTIPLDDSTAERGGGT